MKKSAGFITLHRQIIDWEWYKHPHTAFLFIHLLLSANFTDGVFRGDVIRRGQVVKSIPQLSTDTGLTIQQVKTALAHLRLTGEITDDTSRQYRIITIVKYDDYQKLTDKLTADQPSTNRHSNRRLTVNSSIDQHQYNNNNNINKETIEQSNNTRLRSLSDRFDEFWSAYPRKEGKENARKAFAKLNPDEELLTDIIIAIGKQKASQQWTESGGRYIPYPASWLNGRRWEDETRPAIVQPEQMHPTRTVTAQQYAQRDYSNEQTEAMARMIAMAGGDI